MAGVGEEEGLDARDLEDIGTLVSGLERLAESGRYEIRNPAPDVLAVALFFATRRERKAKAGTPDAFRSFRGVLNYRLRQPPIEWPDWILKCDEEEAARKLSRTVAANDRWAGLREAGRLQ